MPGFEKPQEAPKNPAQGPMDSVFEAGAKDKAKVEYKAEAFSEQELDKKIGKPRKELSTSEKVKMREVINQAKDAIKSNSPDKKVLHGDTQSFSIDDVEFVYLRDESQKVASNKDRLFKKA